MHGWPMHMPLPSLLARQHGRKFRGQRGCSRHLGAKGILVKGMPGASGIANQYNLEMR